VKRKSLSDADRSIWEKVSKTFDKHLIVTEDRKSLKIKSAEELNVVSPPSMVTRSGQNLNSNKYKADIPTRVIRYNHNQLYPGLDRKRHVLLKKGKLSPEKTIDLHGLSTKRAEEEVLAFLFQSYSQGLRLVLVITGKGRNSIQKVSNSVHQTNDIGIIKKSLTSWIKNSDIMPLILHIMPAHSKHGGDGAFYVYLKKRNIR
tara:strand:- start:386 stop:991 length:606 start_codon:yes stop_codon:yes gene_type:complete